MLSRCFNGFVFKNVKRGVTLEFCSLSLSLCGNYGNIPKSGEVSSAFYITKQYSVLEQHQVCVFPTEFFEISPGCEYIVASSD